MDYLKVKQIKKDYLKGTTNFAGTSLALIMIGFTVEEAKELLNLWDNEKSQTDTKSE